MSELREAAQAALTAYETYRDVDDIDGLDDAMDRLRAALAQPKTELRDQHKAFTHWYFGLRGINEANFSPEDLAWAAWKAALAQPEADAGVSWDGHNVRGDADSIAEVRRLIEFEDARQGTKPATVEDIRIYDAIAANYVNAEPKAEPEPVAWQVRWIDPEEGPGAWRCCLDPSEADYYANREDHDWRPLYTHPPRDGWRPASELPTESPIAAKCQRIEGSGEICGLTPPCPDCGSSLIDVPEGSL